jgi:hypothetical protein
MSDNNVSGWINIFPYGRSRLAFAHIAKTVSSGDLSKVTLPHFHVQQPMQP